MEGRGERLLSDRGRKGSRVNLASVQRVPHLEVGRVHPQLVGMLLAELQHTIGKVVDVLDGQADAAHHLGTVGLDGGGAKRQTCPVGEVDLGLGVHGEHPAVEENTSRMVIKMC